MASSLPSSATTFKPFSWKNKVVLKLPHIRCQSFRDEGPTDIVEANLSVLRERIEGVRKKERLLQTCCKVDNGWSYQRIGYDHKQKKVDNLISESLEVMGLVSTAFALVFLSGSVSICIVSFLVHLMNK